ncbi:hypothetical protein G6F40_017784 [Rhizopus arrhizus]|nr:hypothetical protein G6F40_017784 [Rhizopus arrhizus]
MQPLPAAAAICWGAAALSRVGSFPGMALDRAAMASDSDRNGSRPAVSSNWKPPPRRRLIQPGTIKVSVSAATVAMAWAMPSVMEP